MSLMLLADFVFYFRTPVSANSLFAVKHFLNKTDQLQVMIFSLVN